jgi:Hemerythrin HHE cation binding domain
VRQPAISKDDEIRADLVWGEDNRSRREEWSFRLVPDPTVDFDDPLGRLKDCHRGIEHFLQILCVTVQRIQGGPLAEDAIPAVEAALNYFLLGGQRHTVDEQRSLFPRLVATGQFAELGRLEQDHVEAGELHSEIERLYRSWITEGSLHEEDRRRLQASTGRLCELYHAHI